VHVLESVRVKKNEKVRLQIYIPDELDAKFRALVQSKYQKYEKGLLSYEAEMALRHWLSLHTETQNTLDTKPPNPIPKVSLAYMKVKEYLLSTVPGSPYYFSLQPGQQIPRRHLTLAISNTRGSDQRTITKWMKQFKANGLIKPINTGATWELM